MNTSIVVQLFIGFGTIFVSIISSVFIAGARWGSVNQEVRSINDRLAKIEGMFTLRIRDKEE